MKDQFTKTIKILFEKDKQLTLFLGDIGVWSFHDLLEKYQKRAFNLGILEQSMVSVASGFSLNGYIPVVHTIAPFLVERALEQIKIDFGYQKLNGNFVTVGASYDYANLGSTHHCPADIEIINSIPNSNIFVPGNAKEFDILFRQTYSKGLNYFRLSQKTHTENINVNYKKATVIKKGKLGTVIAVGPMLTNTIKATNNLDVTILYYTTISPFDYLTFKNNLNNNKVITIEPYYKGVIAKKIVEKMQNINLSIKTIGVSREFIRHYGKESDHDLYFGLDIKSMNNTIKKCLES